MVEAVAELLSLEDQFNAVQQAAAKLNNPENKQEMLDW